MSLKVRAIEAINKFTNELHKRLSSLKEAYAAYLNNLQGIEECDKIVEDIHSPLYDLLEQGGNYGGEVNDAYGEAKGAKEAFEDK